MRQDARARLPVYVGGRSAFEVIRREAYRLARAEGEGRPSNVSRLVEELLAEWLGRKR